jgi:hypothetical protein
VAAVASASVMAFVSVASSLRRTAQTPSATTATPAHSSALTRPPRPAIPATRTSTGAAPRATG